VDSCDSDCGALQVLHLGQVPSLLADYHRIRPLNVAMAAAQISASEVSPLALSKLIASDGAAGRFLHFGLGDLRMVDIQSLQTECQRLLAVHVNN
jgi:hypothetical protein